MFNKLFDNLKKHPLFIRSVYSETLLEDFFVAAAASVIAIRFYLAITGYPQISFSDLHISHLLFGGLFMLAALVIALGFLDHSAKQLAAILGGIGFGTFIDEIGKFITSDNNYFFEPSIALIYIIFVLLFFVIRYVINRQALTAEECLVNAFDIAEHAAVLGLDAEEARLAQKLLTGCEQKGVAVEKLREILLQMTPDTSHGSHLRARFNKSLAKVYSYLISKWWFIGAIIGFFAFITITPLYTVLSTVQFSWAVALWTGGGAVILITLLWSRRARLRHLNILVSIAIIVISILITGAILASLKQKPLSMNDWAQFLFPAMSAIIVVAGLLMFPISRLRAYNMFRLSTLISIFLTQVLAFYQYQLLALAGLLVNIVVLAGLRYLINNEQAKLKNGESQNTAGIS